jgi:AcrR family transcriptional regulator
MRTASHGWVPTALSLCGARELDRRWLLTLTDGVGSDPVAAPGDQLRDRLVSAAAEVFAEKGYDRARVAEIAERAGLTTGAIYGRFRGKAELLQAAIEVSSVDEFDQLFAEHRFLGDATDILTTVGSHLVTEEFDKGQALLLEAFVAARRDPEVRAVLRRAIDERASQLHVLVDEAKRTGSIDPALDTLSVVRFCHAVGLGFLLMGAADVSRPDAAPWEQLIERLVAAVETPESSPPDAPASPPPPDAPNPS